MKIRAVAGNDHKKVFEALTSTRTVVFPYADAEKTKSFFSSVNSKFSVTMLRCPPLGSV